MTGDLRVMVESSPFYGCIERVEKTRNREKSDLNDRNRKSASIQFMTVVIKIRFAFASFSLNST